MDEHVLRRVLSRIVDFGHFSSLHNFAMTCKTTSLLVRELTGSPKLMRRFARISCANPADITKAKTLFHEWLQENRGTDTADAVERYMLHNVSMLPNHVLHGPSTGYGYVTYWFYLGHLVKDVKALPGLGTVVKTVYTNPYVPDVVLYKKSYPRITTCEIREGANYIHIKRVNGLSKIYQKFNKTFDLLLEHHDFIKVGKKFKLKKLREHNYTIKDGVVESYDSVRTVKFGKPNDKWSRIEQLIVFSKAMSKTEQLHCDDDDEPIIAQIPIALPAKVTYFRNKVIRKQVSCEIVRDGPNHVIMTRKFEKFNKLGVLKAVDFHEVMY